jgi:hypothetical protein
MIKVFFLLLSSLFMHAAMAVDVEYEIREDDELMKISYIFYGTHQKWQRILDDNPNLDPKELIVGTKITVRDAIDKDYSVIVYDYNPNNNTSASAAATPKVVEKEVVKEKIVYVDKPIDEETVKKEKAQAQKRIEQEQRNKELAASIEKKRAEIESIKDLKEKREEELLEIIADLKKENIQLLEQKAKELKENDQVWEDKLSQKDNEIEKLKEDMKEKREEVDQAWLAKFDDLREKNKKLVDEQVKKAQEINLRWEEKFFVLEEEKKAEVTAAVKTSEEWKRKYISVQSNYDNRESELLSEKNDLQIQYNELQLSYQKMSELSEDEASWKEKYFELQKDYITSKENNNKIKDQKSQLQAKYDRLSNWNEEKEDLLEQLDSLKLKYSKLQKESSNQQNKNDLFVQRNLMASKEEVLKEKTKILSQRLWIEKNKDLGQCSLNIVNKTQEKPKYNQLEEIVKDVFGEKSFYFDPAENKLVIRLPGNSVYGVDSPQLNVNIKKHLSQIGKYLKNYAIDKVEFFGHSKYNKLKSESGGVVDREFFELVQGQKLKDFMSEHLYFPQEKVMVGTGHFVLPEDKKNKYFDMAITFTKPLDYPKDRNPATIKKSHSDLHEVTKEIYGKLSEPKYGRLFLNEKSLEIHLGRHYFFDGNNLKSSGLSKLNTILDIFSASNDVGLEVLWVPGLLETSSDKTVKRSVAHVNKLKNYIQKSGKWPENRVNFKITDKYEVLEDAFTEYEDKINRRLIFRVVPLSVSMRYINTTKL